MLPFKGFETVEKLKPRPTYEKFLEPYLTISKSEHARVRSLPQHYKNGDTNPEWIKAREGRLTGSKVADIVGLGYENLKKNNVKAPYKWDDLEKLFDSTEHYEDTLTKLLYSKFKGNVFTAWGNKYEDECEERFIDWLYTKEVYEKEGEGPLTTFTIQHAGLCIHLEQPWMGMSPDGIIHETFQDGTTTVNLTEYKCPYTKKNLDQFATTLYGPMTDRLGNKYPITPYYYCQVIWGMGLLHECNILAPKLNDPKNLYAYFAVWIPAKTEACKVVFDPFFYDAMKKKAKRFWFNRYLPSFYKLKFPKSMEWSGRSIQNMDDIFSFLRTNMVKKKVPLNFRFFDWGCGEGKAMKKANQCFDCDCTGIEHIIPPKPYLTQSFTFHFPVNIMDWGEIPGLDQKETLVHYIYDGGVYPKALSEQIAELIGSSCPRTTFVVLVLSKFPAYDEDKHLNIRKWRTALLGFSKINGKVDVYENEKQEEPTMDAYLFYRKY